MYRASKTEEMRSRTIVLGPEGKISSANNILRQESNDSPGNIISRARGRDETDAGEHKALRPCQFCVVSGTKNAKLTGSWRE